MRELEKYGALIRSYLGGCLSTEEFDMIFEPLLQSEVGLPEPVSEKLDSLFSVVEGYEPPDRREGYPHFTTDDEVRRAAEVALEVLTRFGVNRVK